MTRVKRGGRELIVDDAVVTEYLGNGYSVIDDRGKEITRGKALDYATAMRELAEVKAHDTALAIALGTAAAWHLTTGVYGLTGSTTVSWHPLAQAIAVFVGCCGF